MVCLKGLVFSLLVHCLLHDFGNCVLTQAQLDKLCEGYKDLEVIAHPEGTNKYIVCSDTEADEGACPSNTCFDLKQAQCLKSADPCKTTPSEVSQSDCKTEDFLMKKIPSKDCQMYYVCTAYDVLPKQKRCPLNQHFSKYEQKCVPRMEAYCQPPQQWCTYLSDGKRLAANECFQYYECSHGDSVLKTCAYYQYFNGTECVRGSCANKDGVLSVRKPNCMNEQDLILPHSKCNMYYVCHNNIPLEVQCANGYYFNESSKRCAKDVLSVCDG